MTLYSKSYRRKGKGREGGRNGRREGGMEGAKILMPRVIIIGRKGRVIYVLDVNVCACIYIYIRKRAV